MIYKSINKTQPKCQILFLSFERRIGLVRVKSFICQVFKLHKDGNKRSFLNCTKKNIDFQVLLMTLKINEKTEKNSVNITIVMPTTNI